MTCTQVSKPGGLQRWTLSGRCFPVEGDVQVWAHHSRAEPTQLSLTACSLRALCIVLWKWMPWKGEKHEVSNQEPKAQGDWKRRPCLKAYNRTIGELNIETEPNHGRTGLPSTQLER